MQRGHSPFDRSPVAELYRRYAQTILIYVRRHVSSQEDAEDVLLEVFISALESDILLELGEREQLAWLWRVAHNKFVDHHRRFARRPAVPLEEAAETLCDDEDLAPELVALRHEEHALLRERLKNLSEQQQEVLRLRFANGLRCAEIAKLMNKNEGAVRTLLSRALNLLRSIYENNREGTLL